MTEDPIDVVKRYYYECLNITDGVCYTEWKHEECRILRNILFELTGEEQYSSYDKVWKSFSKVNELLDEEIENAEKQKSKEYWTEWDNNE